jgi:hypothetical protein
MQQYRISEENYKKFRKKWFNVGIPVISAVVAIIVLIIVYSQGKEGEFTTLPYILPVFVAFITFSIFRGLRKQRRLLLSYSVTISDSDITREQYNTPPMTINFMEIKEIVKTRKGSYMIKGRAKTDVIYIPYIIDDAAALEDELGKFAPIAPHAKEKQQRGFKLALALLAIAGFLTLLLTNDKLLICISGVVAIGAFIYRFIELVTNKSIPTNLKRRSWIYLGIVVFVIYTMYTKIF